jgi:hypothetical protein
MAGYLNVPGGGLPLPTGLYPTELTQSTQDWSSAPITISAGASIVIPRGNWIIGSGLVSTVQYLDPVNNFWRPVVPPRFTRQVISDGFNYRIINLTGIPFAGVITTKGSGYTQATTTITPSVGNSVWQAVVGGSLAVSTVANAGAGYSIPPTVAIPQCPAFAYNGIGGVQATAYATLTGGTVNGVTLVNVGAGYTSATVTALLLPSPFDPNYLAGTVTIGSVLFTLTNSGDLTAAILTNGGDAIPNASLSTMSLTVTGAGSSAVVSPLIGQTVLSASVAAAGATYGTSPPLITSVGGNNTFTDALKNPLVSPGSVPLPVYGIGTLASQSLSGVTIYDPGFFVSAPTAIVIPGTGAAPVAASVASVTFSMGSTQDTVTLQPAGGT